MIFRVPVCVTNDRRVKGHFVASCLFAPEVSRRDDNLNRLMSKLARDIARIIEKLGKELRHDAVGRWAFCPPMTQHRLGLDIEMRRRKGRQKALFVVFRHMGRRIAMTPSHPGLWFEIEKQKDLQDRATEALTDHWREREKEDEEDCHPEKESIEGKAWVQTLRLSASVSAELPKEFDPRHLNIGADSGTDGQMELHRVGRCLDWQYPDELDRAVLRDREVDELHDLLESSERRPLLLVGPRLSGKTTLIHEVVHRRVARRNSPFVNRENVWLISPQRLISGMSYVGQWEGRLLAILKHAKKRRHVLYFDDLVGLFLAGISANSTLSAAQVLKPYLERREIRVVGEITPEALRVLQERDRSFADLFHILPVREPGDEDTLRMLVNIQRRLEGKHACGYAIDVLPAVIDLQRRYDRSTAFPGKAARMLTRLAVKAPTESAGSMLGRIVQQIQMASASPFDPKRHISREEVFTEFAAQSGLAKSFLDKTEKLERDKIIEELGKQVIGQPQAIEAAADVIAVAKARLNDPDRPLAAFLFLGPTGVGKTECAKAIARYLFADAERLLRFDMNEYLDPGSAARLVGTFRQPEGLLTAAIRRQPFAVVLLDEIEKADPEVFDLLLQVLGEGRLTDSLGRTADFTNAIIILTSNLGVREAEARVGFGDSADKASPSYLRAAELFFRPEFFNRLDRVIPFRRLSRENTRKIAERIVTEVLEREGFRQRRCILNVSPAAFEEVINSGYDPLMGARAMKRSVERHLTQPAAVRLAELPIDRFTIVTVFAANERVGEPAAGSGLRVDVQPLRRAEPIPQGAGRERPPLEHLGELEERLEAVEELLNRQKPDGDVSSGHVTPEQERYYTLRDSMHALGRELDSLFDRHENNRVAKLEATVPANVAKKARFRAMKVRRHTQPSDNFHTHQPSSSTKNAEDLGEEIRQLAESAEAETGDAEILHLERRIALLEQIAALPPDPRPAYLWIRHAPNQLTLYPLMLIEAYFEGLTGELGLQLTKQEKLPGMNDDVILLRLEGLGARMIAESEAGTHLFCPAHGGILPIRIAFLEEWPPPATDDRFQFGPIIRIYTDPGSVMDLRTGIVTPMKHGLGDAFETMILTTLTKIT